jgi:hypothetical protein
MNEPKAQRCTAHSKSTGKQCGRTAIPGGNVCRYHGGNAPQVRKAAAARLRAMVDPALGVLDYAMKRKSRKLKEAISAAKEVLDRAEFEGEGGPLATQQTVVVRFVEGNG